MSAYPSQKATALANLFNFDDADLDANRQGRLSDKQRTHLVAADRTSRLWAGVSGLGLWVIAIAPLLYLAWLMGVAAPPANIFNAALFPWLCIWLPLWGGLGVFMLRRLFNRPVDTTVAKAAGPLNIVGVERRGSGGRTYTAYVLQVAGQQLEVSGELRSYDVQGETYAVYYLPNAKQIMSLERVN